MPADTVAARNVLDRFRWIDGDADTWDMLRDATSLASIVTELASLCSQDCPEVVAGIEARGFVLAPAVALTLGIGFTPIRKGDALFPGSTASIESSPDYRGTTHRLSARTDHLAPGTRVALVDDWIETGSQALTVRRLLEDAAAELVSVTVIVDEASGEARSALPIIRSIVNGSDLP